MLMVVALGGNALLKHGEAISAEAQRSNVRVAAAQLRDRTFDDGRGRVEIRVAHAQHDHVLAALARRHRLVMREPRIGAIAADALHEGREFHVRTVRVRC